jgi:hypothetical protein
MRRTAFLADINHQAAEFNQGFAIDFLAVRSDVPLTP